RRAALRTHRRGAPAACAACCPEHCADRQPVNTDSFLRGGLSRMPYRRTENVVRRLAARHDAIVQAAGALAAEAGIGAVQITPVSQRAGVATGTVYRYFQSKTDLVAALVASVSEREIG